MGLADCPRCGKFRQAGLERCPKCGNTFAEAEPPLLVLRDAASAQTWDLRRGRLVIGRKDALAQVSLEAGDTAVMLDDGLVSRRHAVIVAEAGAFKVTDTESRDGTHVNEREITETAAIQEGDRLRFGDTVLVASIHQAATPLAARSVDGERTIYQSPAPVEPPARPPVDATASTPQRPTPMPERTTPATERASPAPMPALAVPKPTAGAVVKPQTAISPRQTAISPREVEQELSIVLDMFERNGGRAALKTVLGHARRVEATPERGEALQTLVAWLPAACRMLETELMLIDLLSARASDAPR